MSIITEEMRIRQKAVEYALKHQNNAKAARRYHTSRQQVQRWVKKYDGTIQSLANKSRRPKSHPNQHQQWEIDLIRSRLKRYKSEGLAQVYVECCKKGYSRCYVSMCKQIRKMNVTNTPAKRYYPKSSWKPTRVNFPGEKVQIDIKYVPQYCIGWNSYGVRYYQITAIDEYSRKRVCKIVDEKSVTHTAAFVTTLEETMGFRIQMIQTDNGSEFTNNIEQSDYLSAFEKVLMRKSIAYKKIRPYSPWQNGKVERSHREDTERFYNKHIFKSYDDMIRKHKRYMNRYNNIAKKVLGFKTPNQVVSDYYQQVS